jgi:hypothetical protein
MLITIRCHFDGRVLVPDEPVPPEVPINVPLIVTIRRIKDEDADTGAEVVPENSDS